jgi:hypothetical protein
MLGFPAKYWLAFVLLLAGIALISCGMGVCWLRWGRRRGLTVDEIRRQEHDKDSAKRP